MRGYEGMFVIDASLPEAEQKRVASSIQELLLKNQAHLIKEQALGRRKLGYKMRKRTEGVYYNIYFEITPSSIKDLKRHFMLNEGILKFLIIKSGE